MLRDAPRLYLITPPISDWTPYPLLFDAAMATCDLACVLLRTAARGEDEKEKIVRALAPLLQKHGVACLVADDPQWAVRVNADGAHVDGAGERLQSALRASRPGHIVGTGGLPTRDAAMTAGDQRSLRRGAPRRRRRARRLVGGNFQRPLRRLRT